MTGKSLWAIDEASVHALFEYIRLLERPESVPEANYEDFSCALETIFWASLEVEEGRRVTGSFVIAPPNACSQHLRFKEALAVDIANVRRIALATNPEASALGVWERGVWGVALQIPTGATLITIDGPGKLLVRYGRQVVASVSGRSLEHFAPPAGTRDALLQRHGVAQAHLQYLLDISVWIRRLEHGGAVILDTTIDGTRFTSLCELSDYGRARNWAPKTMAEEAAETQPDDQAAQQRAEADKRSRDDAEQKLCERVARLSAIDGALVIDHELTPLAFGAKIAATDPPPKVDVWDFPAEELQEMKLSDLGGTRHQSAACYAHRWQGSVVLVVSQDGRLSLMSRVDGKPNVQVSRGFERLVPVVSAGLSFGHYVNLRARCTQAVDASVVLSVGRKE